MPSLFDPMVAGDLHLKNRIIMAPLTRSRAGEDRVPNELMATYYAQRATAGLIITEATSVTPHGVGYERTPGIWSEEQVAGWRLTTDAVHAAGGKIVLQLWHVGRISDPSFLNGDLPVAPSAIRPAGHVALLRPERAYVTPRALETNELGDIVANFKNGAANALKAGFDGVEIHAANGYLLDQFLQDSTNVRTDRYGGPIENRARLLLEVVDACAEVWSASRVGVHLAPRGDVCDMGDSDPAALFGYVASELGKRHIAFICVRDTPDEISIRAVLRNAFDGIYILNQGIDKAKAEQLLTSGHGDAVAFGQMFIANPDLPIRLRNEGPFNPLDPSTFYSPGPKGYTDYPVLA